MADVTVLLPPGAGDVGSVCGALARLGLDWQLVCGETSSAAPADRVVVIEEDGGTAWLDRAAAAATGRICALAGATDPGAWLTEHLRLHAEHPEAVVFTVTGTGPDDGDHDLPPFQRLRCDALSAPTACLRAVERPSSLAPPVLAWTLWRTGLRAISPSATLPETLAEARARGAAHAAAAGGDAELLAALLGSFGWGTPREPGLRRILLAARVPPSVIRRLLGVFPLPAALADEVAWRYAFWLGALRVLSRRRRQALVRPVRILMYHGFATEAELPSRYVVASRAFRRQLLALRLLGFRVVPLADVVERWRRGLPAPRRAVVLTVDDAYVDVLTVAAPILRRLRLPASLFVPTAWIGAPNAWSSDRLQGRPILDAAGLEALLGYGVELEAHSRTHSHLDEAGVDLDDEVAGSRWDLEPIVGRPPELFAYPGGRFSHAAIHAVERAGFAAACSTRPRSAYPGGSLFLLPRIEISGGTPLRSVLRIVLRGRK